MSPQRRTSHRMRAAGSTLDLLAHFVRISEAPGHLRSRDAMLQLAREVRELALADLAAEQAGEEHAKELRIVHARGVDGDRGGEIRERDAAGHQRGNRAIGIESQAAGELRELAAVHVRRQIAAAPRTPNAGLVEIAVAVVEANEMRV